MITAIFSRLAILLFGTLYPAYASYKAVRTKNVKEYVKWMMYWIVFAFFTCVETFTDIFLSWLPLYYEVKVIVVLWLLNPATKGSSVLYRKFVHPMLTRREQEIDEYLNQAKERGYTAVIQLGSKGVNYATNVIMQTALKTFGQQPLDLDMGTQRRILPSSRSENAISSRLTTATNERRGGSRARVTTYDEADGAVGGAIPRSYSLGMDSRSEFTFQDAYLHQGSSEDEHIMSETLETYDEFNINFNERLRGDENDINDHEEPVRQDHVLPRTRKPRAAKKKPSESTTIQNTEVEPKLERGSKYAVRGRRRIRDASSTSAAASTLHSIGSPITID